MRMMAFYGKGGIGKSTVVTNLSILFARAGRRVLQFGCDPKSDSCHSMVRGRVVTVMDEWLQRGEADLKLEHCLMRGPHGVECIEVGGPTPGSGCGGRGITKAFELVGDPGALRERYDIILFDVLGDVVCGGFSAPMRSGYAEEVYIVTSGEIRSLYAANNISHAVRNNSRNGVRLGGLIGNLRGGSDERKLIGRLAEELGSRVIHHIPRDKAVQAAERKRTPCVEFDAKSPAGRAFAALWERVDRLRAADLCVPRPLAPSEFDRIFLASDQSGSSPASSRWRKRPPQVR
ncbi:MAG: hypothetical protein QME96_04690 [Myxococcota bacterium]|nr:hypothetical protein [Myxococcota bacterium]